MELSGKVIQILPEIGGNSKSGNVWRKQEFIIETGGQYPKKVCVSLWGERIDQYPLQTGDNVNLSVDIESREYNNRWYTEVKAFKIEKQGGSASYQQIPEIDTFHSEGEEDKLPF